MKKQSRQISKKLNYVTLPAPKFIIAHIRRSMRYYKRAFKYKLVISEASRMEFLLHFTIFKFRLDLSPTSMFRRVIL